MQGPHCREIKFRLPTKDNKKDERIKRKQCRMILFYLHLIFLFRFLLPSAASEDTLVTFPDFKAGDDFMTIGDVAHNSNNRSYVFNAGATHAKGSCGAVLYTKKVRIQNIETGKPASFSTSFSFKFTYHGSSPENSGNPNDGLGFSFAFIPEAMQGFMSGLAPSGACHSYQGGPEFDLHPPGFVVIYGRGCNPSRNIPSKDIIRVYKNLDYEYDIAAYTHNLCGNHASCSYFANGRVFTAWIDFDSNLQTLEVRLTNGSYPTVKKPLQPLLVIPNYVMPSTLEDVVFPSFWGSSTTSYVETHELLSWSFGIHESHIPSSTISFLRSLTKVTPARIALGVFGVLSALAILGFISRVVARLSRHHGYTALDYTTEGPHVFSYSELRKATAKFDDRNLLGAGGSGSVYRGALDGRRGVTTSIAVKQINCSQSKLAEALFQAEVSSLGQIRHRNVVQLLGWCQEKGRLLLVYDFMSNGGLDKWLHERGSRQVLTLQMRHSILEGVGAALEYLHEDCQSVVLHRDIKSSNVLLDADFRAHLGDFGLARLMDHRKSDRTTLPAGTLGYMAPEMPYTGKATKESDVYSFGMLVLEVVCGRRPLDMQAVEPEDLMLLNAVWRARESRSLLSAVDPKLVQILRTSMVEPLEEDDSAYAINPFPRMSTSSHSLISSNTRVRTVVDINIEVCKQMLINLLHLGLLCCLPNPKARPSMGQVNCILQQIREVESHFHDGAVDMPPLPISKPLGLYQSLEFSQTNLSPTSSTPSFVSSSEARTFVENSSLQQGSASLHKDD